MQLANDNPDDGIVGPVASGFWHAIADEVERLDHDKKAGHPSKDRSSKKRLSLVSDKVAKADVVAPTDNSTEAHETTGDVVDDPDDEHSTEDATDPKHSHRFRKFFVSNFRVTILAVIAGGLAIALALTSLGLSNKNSADAARASALNAAKTYAVAVGGYNYKNMSQDFGAVMAVSTPSFRKNFSQASSALETTLVRYHATATAKVVSAGIVSSTATSATALVFLDQNVTNSIQKSATTDRTQVEMTLIFQNGKWLINNVTLL